MNTEQEQKINALSIVDLQSLFWQTDGWMKERHKTELDDAVESAMYEIELRHQQ